MKIVIIRFSSIGDIVLTTPIIRAIKTQLSKVELHYVTKPEYADIIENNPYVDKVHVLDGSLFSLIGKLISERFDFICDLHNNLRTRIVRMFLNSPGRGFPKINIEKWIMVNTKVDRLPPKHIVDRYFETLRDFTIEQDEKGLEYYIPDKDEVEMEWLPKEFSTGFYTVVIGAKHFTKRLPTQKIIELCDRINKPVVLLGGKEETAIGEEIEKFFEKDQNNPETEESLHRDLGKKAVVFNGCGKFNLNQSASLIKNSGAVFSHDTGLMHIAAAFNKKVFSIWGNTIPKFGMYPYKTSFVVFENNKINCRPCTKLGYSKCPKGHFKCMNDITFDFYLPD